MAACPNLDDLEAAGAPPAETVVRLISELWSGDLLDMQRASDPAMWPTVEQHDQVGVGDLAVLNQVVGRVPEVEDLKGVMARRAGRVTDSKDIQRLVDHMVAERCDEWIDEATRGGRRLGYEAGRRRKRGQGDIAALLRRPGPGSWDRFTAPLSLREVEPGVRLVMSPDRLPEGPPWKPRQRDSKPSGEER